VKPFGFTVPALSRIDEIGVETAGFFGYDDDLRLERSAAKMQAGASETAASRRASGPSGRLLRCRACPPAGRSRACSC
jgi:hypothetical protein